MSQFYNLRNTYQYHQAYQLSLDNPEEFWADIASQFNWSKQWHEVISGTLSQGNVRWFDGAKLNITSNCIDRYIGKYPDNTAFTWIPNNPSERKIIISYQKLYEEVNRWSNCLKSMGIKKGDRVAIYMPMIPETLYAMLACARVGAVHTVVFAGFSAQSLADRINDAQAKLILCSDGMFRADRVIPVKEVVDQAITQCPCVQNVLVVQRTKQKIEWKAHLDVWWHEIREKQGIHCQAESMSAEDPLFILYTSGSTGKPKGVLHTCAGYMVYAAFSFNNVFQYNRDDVFWCTADVGWITGHSYLVYGPLLNRAHSVVFEGVPTYPNPDRCWQIIEQEKVNQFYTAPTLIRSLMAAGNKWIDQYDLRSLKTIGSVGEPINEEAWNWYFEKVGRKRAALVDTWWQTETGGIMISGLGGIFANKATYAGLPLPGIQPCLLDPDGKQIDSIETEGLLCIKSAWPSMIRDTWGDRQRYLDTYLNPFPGMYFTGDGAKRDAQGFYRILGRVDDVINVSGHRLGTAEIENAVNQHPAVAESAVVGYPHDIKGQGIYVYAILHEGFTASEALKSEINASVENGIGKIARLDVVQFVSALPKTRSGKIMRRILRKIAEGHTSDLGDISTLLDPLAVEQIKEGAQLLRKN